MNIEEIKQALLSSPTIYANVGGKKLRLSGDVTLNNALINLACGTVTIGNGSFLGYNVCLLTGSHHLDGVRSRAPQGRDIVIGCFVWIASNATILGPCTIGDRCVVAAGAVVPPRSILEAGWMYAGVPVRKVRPAIDIRANAGIGPLLLTDQRKRK
jgi:acetyltransferase-like isoleucine patch superfamily enzyme